MGKLAVIKFVEKGSRHRWYYVSIPFEQLPTPTAPAFVFAPLLLATSRDFLAVFGLMEHNDTCFIHNCNCLLWHVDRIVTEE